MTSDDTDLLQDLMLLTRASQLVLQERVLAQVKNVDLNPAKLNVLRLLARRKKQSVNDLARFLEYTKAAASQNVDRLVRAGLVRRQTDDRDRRLTWISLTPKGRRVLAKLEEIQRRGLEEALRRIPPSTRKVLERGMRQLAFSLLEITGAGPKSCLQCCAYSLGDCLRGEHERAWSCRYAARNAEESETT